MHVEFFVCLCVNAGQPWEESCSQRATKREEGIDIKRPK
jgi:hypothetical protein